MRENPIFFSSNFNVASPPPLHPSSHCPNTTAAHHCWHNSSTTESNRPPKTIPWTDPGCSWPPLLISITRCILYWLFLEIKWVYTGVFLKNRERTRSSQKRKGGRRRRNPVGASSSEFRLAADRKERFGSQRAETVGPALCRSQPACRSARSLPTPVFRLPDNRTQRFGPQPADGVLLL